MLNHNSDEPCSDSAVHGFRLRFSGFKPSYNYVRGIVVLLIKI